SWQHAAAPVTQAASLPTGMGQSDSGSKKRTLPQGETPQYHIVAQPTHGTVTLISATTQAVTKRPGTAAGADSFTFRVGAGGQWSTTATVRISVASPDGLVGAWDLDENQGIVAADSSGWSHTGSLVGGATWAPGVVGSAVRSDGSTGYV